MRLARRMQHGVLSPSVELANRVRRLRASGADIINFGTRPDVPANAREAAIAFLHSGASSAYTDARGLPELRHAIAAKLARDLVVVVDESYERLVYGERRHVSMASLEGMRERTVTVQTTSKVYNMAGWRVGWLIAPPELAREIVVIQSNSITCPTSFAQAGAAEALRGSIGMDANACAAPW